MEKLGKTQWDTIHWEYNKIILENNGQKNEHMKWANKMLKNLQILQNLWKSMKITFFEENKILQNFTKSSKIHKMRPI